MALKISTGLRNAMLSGGTLKATLDGGYIHIYSGTPPASPNDEITGTLLATIYSDGGSADAGLNFDASAADGVLAKAPAETWDNSDTTNVATGTATHYLHVASAESDGTAIDASTTAERILGSVGTAGTDMVMGNTELTSGQVQSINFYSVALPETC